MERRKVWPPVAEDNRTPFASVLECRPSSYVFEGFREPRRFVERLVFCFLPPIAACAIPPPETNRKKQQRQPKPVRSFAPSGFTSHLVTVLCGVASYPEFGLCFSLSFLNQEFYAAEQMRPIDVNERIISFVPSISRSFSSASS